jgi:hypothetical protein
MRNIIDQCHLTSATAAGGRGSRKRMTRIRRESQRRRERKSAALPLGTLGSLVSIPVRNFRNGSAEGRPSSSSVRRIAAPQIAEHNGGKLSAMSARSLEQAWLKQHHAEYAGAWVALEGGNLVAQGSSARQVLEAAKAKGYQQPLVVHVPCEPQLPFGGW